MMSRMKEEDKCCKNCGIWEEVNFGQEDKPLGYCEVLTYSIMTDSKGVVLLHTDGDFYCKYWEEKMTKDEKSLLTIKRDMIELIDTLINSSTSARNDHVHSPFDNVDIDRLNRLMIRLERNMLKNS